MEYKTNYCQLLSYDFCFVPSIEIYQQKNKNKMASQKFLTKANVKFFFLIVALFTLLTAAGFILNDLFRNSEWFSSFQTSVLTVPFKRRGLSTNVGMHLLAMNIDAQEENTDSCDFPAVDKPEFKGEFIEKEQMVPAFPGSEFAVTMYLKNTGNVPWFGDATTCSPVIRLGTAREQDRDSIFSYFTTQKETGWIQSNRIRMLEKRVDPGSAATFTFVSRAPDTNDTYREYFQPVIEGKGWLTRAEETARVDIAVGDTDALDAERLKFINKSSPASVIADPAAPRELHVDISEQKAHLKVGDVTVREYIVSTGTFKTPTPLGTFKIEEKNELRIGSKAPHYRMPKFQRFTKQGAGLHALPYLANDKGTFWNEALNHIGRPVSHGCVRFLPDDAADIFNLTAVGDTISITR